MEVSKYSTIIKSFNHVIITHFSDVKKTRSIKQIKYDKLNNDILEEIDYYDTGRERRVAKKINKGTHAQSITDWINVKCYYPNGMLQSNEHLFKNMLSGVQYYYHNNGNLRELSHHLVVKNDKTNVYSYAGIDGTQKIYAEYDDNRLIIESKFIKGKEVEKIVLNKNGNVISHSTFHCNGKYRDTIDIASKQWLN